MATSKGCQRRFFFCCGAATQRGSWPSHFWVFLDHTQRRSTVGRTPLDEWSARRRDLYLTTHNTHTRQTSMPPVGFESTVSAGERPQTYVLDHAATGTGIKKLINLRIINKFLLDLSTDTQFRCTISIDRGHIPPSLQAKCPPRCKVSVAFPMSFLHHCKNSKNTTEQSLTQRFSDYVRICITDMFG